MVILYHVILLQCHIYDTLENFMQQNRKTVNMFQKHFTLVISTELVLKLFFFSSICSDHVFLSCILLTMLLQLSQLFHHGLPPPSIPHSLRQSPHHCSHPLVMHRFFCYSISHTVLYIPMAILITTYLYFVIFSPLYPVPHITLPSGKHQNALCIRDSVSVLLAYLVCFLDSIVKRYVFLPFYCS